MAKGPELRHLPSKNNWRNQRNEIPPQHGMLHTIHCLLDTQKWKAGIRLTGMLEIPIQISHEHLPLTTEHPTMIRILTAESRMQITPEITRDPWSSFA